MNILSRESRSHLEDLSEHVFEYIDSRWDLIVLNLTEKSLAAASVLISGFIFAIFGGFALIFICIGTAIWLNGVLSNPFVGYFIMAAVFLIILFFVLGFARNYIRTVITDTVLLSIQDIEDVQEEQQHQKEAEGKQDRKDI